MVSEGFFDDLGARWPVIPVVVADSTEEAVAVCRALRDGGIGVVEIVLRTPAALAAIEAVATRVEDVVVGAGTVVRPEQLAEVARAGARFAVSPGFTAALAEAATRLAIPFLPGVLTPSEILAARASGTTRLKYFPAEAGGGPRALQAFGEVFPDVRFVPTGGIGRERAPAYLVLGNVLCVGGSWPAPRELVAARDYAAITALARQATALRRAA